MTTANPQQAPILSEEESSSSKTETTIKPAAKHKANVSSSMSASATPTSAASSSSLFGNDNDDNHFPPHMPHDKVQYHVQTPYGRGMTVRTQTRGGQIQMREIELLDWKTATTAKKKDASTTSKPTLSSDEISKSIQDAARNAGQNSAATPPPRLPPKPATLYSSVDFPSVPPRVGDEVMTQFGRGVVQDMTTVADDDTRMCRVLISSWRLAHRSRVTCHLRADSVRVVRPKRLYERTVYEKVEYATELKSKAAHEFAQKRYDKALDLYHQATEAVRYVQHDKQSNNEVRADLLHLLITCHNNAGTCCTHVKTNWKPCLKYATNALTLIDALEQGGGPRIHAILQRDHGLTPTKLFGQYKVKSLLLQAKAQLHLGKLDECLATLKQAHTVIQTYTTKKVTKNDTTDDKDTEKSDDAAVVKHLLQNDKEVKLLHQRAKDRKAQQKKTERRRARAMFGNTGNTTTNKEEDGSPTKNNDDDSGETPTTSKSKKTTTAAAETKRRVSFSETVQQYEIDTTHDNDDDLAQPPWYQDADFLIGLSVFAGAALVAALATKWLVLGGSSTAGGPRSPRGSGK